ncbi:UNVERIFIED_CONTAM: Glutathione S-transferase U17 [Sesamum angustifolium]|uniref:Glutathione S-transferase n=1 Tax=Sesamum angustifolium TaxID=2727405 RepID=A0AAW2Q9D0_9LAMI
MATSAGVQLLGSWCSAFSNRVQLALKLKSVEYEFVEEVFYVNKSERLLNANPVYQKIPVLIHDEKPLCESLVIIEYIDEVWNGNGPSILPSDPYERAIARFWAGYMDNKTRLLSNIAKGKRFFGGEDVGYLDFALGCFLGWVKATEIIGGVKLLDESRTPGLAGWAERFRSHDVAKDIIPEAPKLLELIGYVQEAQ